MKCLVRYLNKGGDEVLSAVPEQGGDEVLGAVPEQGR